MLQVNDPIQIISNISDAGDSTLHTRFMNIVSHIYQYNCLKPLMDLSATKGLQQVLRFKIQDKKFFELDEGNCRTIESTSVNTLLNKFKRTKKYIITIKKIGYDVVIHEIAHMLEKEVDLPLKDFSQMLLGELKGSGIDNIALKSVIKNVLFEEVSNYPESHRESELFARYFQIIAMAKDVSGFASTAGYDVKTVLYWLSGTQSWIEQNVYPRLALSTDPEIAKASVRYIKPIDQVQHKWSEQKARSIHQVEKSWKKTIKSIKD